MSLLVFFESEPRLADADIPWVYNNLVFETAQGENHIRCEIEPSDGELKLLWTQNGIVRLDIKLNKLAHLSIFSIKYEEVMTVTNLESNPGIILKIRLKPAVAVEWNCWYEAP
jgi:hypothetical protein